MERYVVIGTDIRRLSAIVARKILSLEFASSVRLLAYGTHIPGNFYFISPGTYRHMLQGV